MNKVWYRNNDQLEVDVFADRTAALRRAASMVTDKMGSDLLFVGIEDEHGSLISLDEFDAYVQGYRVRGLAAEPSICPKYYVEVRSPEAIQRSTADTWVRFAIEPTKVRADRRARDAESIFGPGRTRVVGVLTKAALESSEMV